MMKKNDKKIRAEKTKKTTSSMSDICWYEVSYYDPCCCC
jgi:hypothetical protein